MSWQCGEKSYIILLFILQCTRFCSSIVFHKPVVRFQSPVFVFLRHWNDFQPIAVDFQAAGNWWNFSLEFVILTIFILDLEMRVNYTHYLVFVCFYYLSIFMCVMHAVVARNIWLENFFFLSNTDCMITLAHHSLGLVKHYGQNMTSHLTYGSSSGSYTRWYPLCVARI